MLVSIIIKTLNEARNIERAVLSSLEALSALSGPGEVVVADSLSNDATVELASRHPVRIVQLTDPADRCCGVGAQLGFAVAQGEFLYILDGDMAFEPGFLSAAVAALQADPRLAGVGGLVREMNLDNEEFVNRAARKPQHMRPGAVDRLDMGGLYRRTALLQVGYFTNRALHAYEEFELAARLVTLGWRMKRLDVPGIQHFGHTETSYRLLIRRWRSRYAWGCGELLRESWGKPYMPFVLQRLHAVRFYTAVLVWLTAGLSLTVAAVARSGLGWVALAWWTLPLLLMAWRRRSLSRGLYAVTSWLVFSIGMVAGLLSRPRRGAHEPVSLIQVR